MKVLVIDDSDAIRPRMETALGDISGIVVKSFAPRSGGTMQCIAKLKPDAVVISICADGGSIGLIRVIKSTMHPPVVIAMSGSSSIQYRAACHGAGAEYFFDMDREQPRMLEAISELQKELNG